MKLSEINAFIIDVDYLRQLKESYQHTAKIFQYNHTTYGLNSKNIFIFRENVSLWININV